VVIHYEEAPALYQVYVPYLTSSYLTLPLIAMQNLVVVSHTVCAQVHRNFEDAAAQPPPTPWNGGVADPLETRLIMPNLVILWGQST